MFASLGPCVTRPTMLAHVFDGWGLCDATPAQHLTTATMGSVDGLQ